MCDWQQKLKDGGRTGYTNIKYELLSTHDITIDKTHLKMINVELKCDEAETPWCNKQAPKAAPTAKQAAAAKAAPPKKA